MYTYFTWMLLMSVSISNTFAQSHIETINRTLTFTNDSKAYVVFAENINGFVEVSPSNSEEVKLEAEVEISGENQKIVDQGKREVKLISKVLKDTILIYVECPAINYYRHDRKRRFSYNSVDIDYDFNVDIKLKIPSKAMADISTINDGDVIINNHQGKIKASNVNGNISISEANQILKAVTVNGDIDITCKQTPEEEVEFKTINGDIRIQYPEKLSANLKFKSFNGEFFTDYQVVKYLPGKLITNKSKTKGSTYKIEGYTIVQVGEGGVPINMESFNGNVYIGSNKL